MKNKHEFMAKEERFGSLATLFGSIVAAGLGVCSLATNNELGAALSFIATGALALKSIFSHVSYEQEKTRALLLDNNVISCSGEGSDVEKVQPEPAS